MPKVYLSLGSNIGSKEKNLNKAISLLKTTPSIHCVISSSFYLTEPQGYKNQEDFLNCVISLETNLDPLNLLKLCQHIESKLKRVRLFKWGPRIIDLDILLYDNIKINLQNLIIPHPRMLERAFVLVPLSEFTSEYNEYIEKLNDQSVKLIQT